jgi:hypothetical protein
MQIFDFEQGTPEWFQARLGVPTASCFAKLITSTGKKSAQMAGYLNELVAESITGAGIEGFSSVWMDRGNEIEPQARCWFEFQTGHDIDQVGLVKLDSGLAGASPDGLTPTGGLEIKCPKSTTHTGYLIANKIPSTYVAQVQGCMWICERDTWDFVSYHPDMPKLLISVPRDEAFIKTLADLVDEITDKKLNAIVKIEGMIG